MAESKEIYCPKCQRKVATWDGRSTTNIVASCIKCHKKIVYHTDTHETEVKPYPQRATSSGMTYI